MPYAGFQYLQGNLYFIHQSVFSWQIYPFKQTNQLEMLICYMKIFAGFNPFQLRNFNFLWIPVLRLYLYAKVVQTGRKTKEYTWASGALLNFYLVNSMALSKHSLSAVSPPFPLLEKMKGVIMYWRFLKTTAVVHLTLTGYPIPRVTFCLRPHPRFLSLKKERGDYAMKILLNCLGRN